MVGHIPIVTPVTECLIENLGFTEGPLWTRQGTLMAVGMSRGVFHEIDVADRRVLRSTATGGSPSGLAQDRDGAILIAQGGKTMSGGEAAPAIQRAVAAKVSPLWSGFHAPNDLAFSADGWLWFTDPQGPAMDGESLPGRLWRGHPATGALELVRDLPCYPNGLAFTPGDDCLVVAQTFDASIVRLPKAGAGAPQPFIQLASGRPDGLAFDAAGNLHVAATSDASVQVFSPSGTLVEILQLPEGAMVTNLCFGGADLATLFITSPRGGRIYSIARTIPGLPLR